MPGGHCLPGLNLHATRESATTSAATLPLPARRGPALLGRDRRTEK